MRSPVVVATLAVTLLAACSGDDDAQDLAGTTTMDTTVDTTTTVNMDMTTTTDISTTTTTDISTTSTPAGMSTTTVENTTTTPTTLDPAQDYVAIAETILKQAEVGWLTAVQLARDPFNDDLRARLSDFYTGVQLEGRLNVNDTYRAEDLYEVENSSEPDSLYVDPASLAINEDRTLATVQACEVTSGVVYERGGNSDGSDRIVEDGVGRVVVEFEVIHLDGTWKIQRGRSPDELERIASCD